MGEQIYCYIAVGMQGRGIQKRIQKSRKWELTKHVISELSETVNSQQVLDESTQASSYSLGDKLMISLRSQIEEKSIASNQQLDLQKIIEWAYDYTKTCEKCGEQGSKKTLVYCKECEDAWHVGCIEGRKYRKKPRSWTCGNCERQMEEERQKKRSSLLNHEFKVTTLHDRCGRCKKDLGAEKKKCLKCRQQYHDTCFEQATSSSSKRGSSVLVCCFCYNQVMSKVRQNHTLDKYFAKVSPQKPARKHFRLPKPCDDEHARVKAKESLLFALEVQDIQFNDDLVYDDVSSKDNDTKLEPILQKLEGDDLQAFLKFKRLSRDANYAPVKVVQDPVQGFVVQAVEDIPPHTLICEYAGVVRRYRDEVFTHSDSMMTLLRTNRSQTTLVIIPDKFGNLARYLSGVNNTDKKLKQKQNVQSARYDVDGQARVILYTIKTVKQGHLLYYDYNAGEHDQYDTSTFV